MSTIWLPVWVAPFHSLQQKSFQTTMVRDFSEYLTLAQTRRARVGLLGQCLCATCNGNDNDKPPAVPQTTVANATTTNDNRQTASPPSHPHINTINKRSANHAALPTIAPQCITVHPPPPNLNLPHQAAIAIAPQPFVPQHFILQQQYPYYFVAPMAPPPCCEKYSHWLHSRRGRPPHHPLCVLRYGG